jgi:hypothetical protein
MRGDRYQPENTLVGRQPELPIVKVRPQRYANYDHWMTGELVKLVERWSHFATYSGDRPRIATPSQMGTSSSEL